MQILTQLLENVSACEDLRGCVPVAHSWWISRHVDAKHSLPIRNVATVSSREAFTCAGQYFCGEAYKWKSSVIDLVLCSVRSGNVGAALCTYLES